MTTIKDVAKYTGLSIATISKYMNGGNVLETNRLRIKEAVEHLNYKPSAMARGLKTSKTMTIGLLIPSFKNIFFTNIVSIIEEILQEQGYGSIVCDYKENEALEAEKLEFLVHKQVDGIIMVSLGAQKKHIENVLKSKTPVILIDRMIGGLDCDVVLADNLNATYKAVEELIVRQHKRIGIICGPKEDYTAIERKKGYERVHKDYGQKLDESLMINGAYTFENGYNALKTLWWQENRPTAVLVTNYEMTIGAIMAINELKINIPQDLSIIGYDNIQMAKVVNPPLSIVEQPMEEIGRAAATVLIKRLNGDYTDFPVVVRLKTEVHIKASVIENK